MKPASLNLSQNFFTHSLQARIKKYTVGISNSSDSFEAKCLVKGNSKDTNIPYEWSAQLVPSLYLTFNTTGIQWNQSIILLIYFKFIMTLRRDVVKTLPRADWLTTGSILCQLKRLYALLLFKGWEIFCARNFIPDWSNRLLKASKVLNYVYRILLNSATFPRIAKIIFRIRWRASSVPFSGQRYAWYAITAGIIEEKTNDFPWYGVNTQSCEVLIFCEIIALIIMQIILYIFRWII